MDVAVFNRVQCHSAVCVYGGSLVFCLFSVYSSAHYIGSFSA